ncbi:MAG: EscU/YscU/HrcU family type III secretion system export apparatus switch protein [Acidimicrobiia bacterium]|nr:EscU/YscU/HrcU family type III secretion system export apparatus switch protein [Acidimicrobiia bacterium]
MADDTGQKTEKPTPRRLREARKKGQIPRSVDLVQWVTLLAASFILPSVLRSVLTRVDDHYLAAIDLAARGEAGLALATAVTMTGSALIALSVLFGFVLLASIVGMVAQGGLVLTAHPVRPKWERISPKAGFRRLFSVHSAMETAKAVARLLVLAVLVSTTLVAAAGNHLFAAGLSLRSSTELLIDQVLLVLRIAALIGSLIGFTDYAFQRRQAMKKLKMTKREVKEDQKASEGDPVIRNRRRSAHAKLTRNQMLTAVGDATVIIVNPTHYAVALAYGDDGRAPVVVAKGTDQLSWRIRERAGLAGVPIVESPPLARALHASVELGETIPEAFFEAVAIVLAFVLRKRRNTSPAVRRVAVPASKIPVLAEP